MQQLLSTKEVAKLLGVNEKMIYSLITEKGLPATKITGKWLFPGHLVEQWVESRTINYPKAPETPSKSPGLLIIAGSNDLLLERSMQLYMRQRPDSLAAFGNLGSMGGLKALRQGLCHMASSHLLQEGDEGEEYNFSYAEAEFNRPPAVVNFCRRMQGLILAPGNPKGVEGFGDLAKPGVRIVNRQSGTGTRVLLDHELAKAEVDPARVQGYDNEAATHMALGMQVLSGKADVGLGIQAAAELLGLDFIPVKWERFDLLVTKEHFFNQDIQAFLSLLQEAPFQELAAGLEGYDVNMSGKIVFPREDA